MKINQSINRFALGLMIASACIFVGCTYQQIMQKQLKELFGSDFSDYFWFSMATDNFGVGTSYDVASGSIDPVQLDNNYVCSMWGCLGEDYPTNQQDQLDVYGYADYGDGGQPSLTQSDQKDAGLSGILPQVFKVLNLNAGINWTNMVSFTISPGEAYKRFLIPDKFTSFVMSQPNSSTLKKSYLNGTLVTAVSDLVLEGLSVTIQVTNDIDGNLTASLTKAVGSVLGTNSSLSLYVNSDSVGQYTFKTTKPTIVAVLYKRWPAPVADTNNIATEEKMTTFLMANANTPEKFMVPSIQTKADIHDYEKYWSKNKFGAVKVTTNNATFY